MKKPIATILVTGMLVLTGCATTSPWDGMPYQEANSWQGIGVQPLDARSFRAKGFTPTDAKEWIQVGISSPNVIAAWHQAGFSARDASKWMEKGIELEKAASFRALGLTVE